MDHKLDEIKNILDYWYKLELFMPFWPEIKGDRVIVDKNRKIVPYGAKTNDANDTFVYNIYLGKITLQDLIEDMFNAIGEKDDLIDKDTSLSCVCVFQLSYEGKYIEKSFRVVNLIWATAKVIESKSLNVALDESEIKEFNKEIDSSILDELQLKDKIMSYEDLMKIFKFVMNKIPVKIKMEDNEFYVSINKEYIKTNNNNSAEYNTDSVLANDNNFKQDEIESDSVQNMVSSFYLTDIMEIINSLKEHEIENNNKIVDYIGALKEDKNRIEICKNEEEMENWLLPDKFPLGK